DEGDDVFVKLARDINKGLWNGTSIGIDFKLEDVKFGGYGFPNTVPVIIKSELGEISLTPVPSNKNALKLSLNGEKITPEELKMKLSALADSNKVVMNKFLLAFISAAKLSA